MNSQNTKLLSFEDVDLYKCDVQPLTTPAGWLTDNTMNFAACYICLVYASVGELIKYSSGEEFELYSSCGLSPEKWALIIYSDSIEPGNAFSGSHWCLLLFDPFKKKFWLFDSMPVSTYLSKDILVNNSGIYQVRKNMTY